MSKFNIGDVIWFFRWGTICEARITDVNNSSQSGVYYDVNLLSVGGWSSGGSTRCLQTEAYPDRDSCLTAMQIHSESRRNAFCSKIKTIQDLVQFMLDNVLFGEDCDWDARRAAIDSAHRLGIDIVDEE